MTALLHRLTDDQGEPIAGQAAVLTVHNPASRPASGTYTRVKTVTAVSDDDGWLRWVLTSVFGQQVLSYEITGIEPGKTVLVSVPSTVSTALVSETRVGYVTPGKPPAPAVDLVTEAELAQRLAGLGAGAGGSSSGVTQEYVDTKVAGNEGIDAIVRLTKEEYDALTVKDATTLYVVEG